MRSPWLVAFLGLMAASLPLSCADDAPVDPPVVGPPADALPDVAPQFEAQAASPQQLAALVAAGKEEAKAALANADATWDAYLAAQRTQIDAASAEAGALPKSLDVLRKSAASGDAALARRKRIFIRNLKDIVRRNARSGDELVFGVNNFTHLSPKEFRDAYLTSFGHQADGAGGRKLLQTVGTRQCSTQRAFPFGNLGTPGIDHRALGTVTPVRNQGQCGSCVAFASMAAIESAFIAKWKVNGFNNGNTDLSEQEQLSCTTGDGCQGTSYLEPYIDRATCRGVTYEAVNPYLSADRDSCPGGSRYNSAITGWAFAPTTEKGIAQALQHNPAVIALDGSVLQSYKAGYYNCGTGSTVNHATAVVAYFTGIRMSNGETWNLFYVKNSWGTGWGESGYFGLRASCGSPGALRMFAIPSVVPIRG